MEGFHYDVVTDLRISRRLTVREIAELEYINFFNEIDPQDFHTFYEIRQHPNYLNYPKIDGEDRLREDYYPRFSNWFYDEYNLTMDHDEEPDNFIITTLHYLVKKFFVPNNIDIWGKVSCINRNIKEAYVYDIRNDNFTYNINESIDILEDWNRIQIQLGN